MSLLKSIEKFQEYSMGEVVIRPAGGGEWRLIIGRGLLAQHTVGTEAALVEHIDNWVERMERGRRARAREYHKPRHVDGPTHRPINHRA